MRTVRFMDPAGTVRTGEWLDDGVRWSGRTYDPSSVDVLPPVEPSKILCVGANYRDHIEEMGLDEPVRPACFLKGPNAVSGHEDTVPLLPGIERIDYEAELGVVIGEDCRDVDEREAMDVVAGFTCVNDVSNRDDQLHGPNRGMDLFRGKAFDNSAPMGPVVASPDLVPEDATIELRLNGEVEQRSSLAEQVFSVPELVADLSSFVTLERGDVVTTGTPSGVGPLGDGDTVEITIEGVGTLRHYVAASRER